MDYIISDGPPGIGCPVISSLSGADVALLITEPSLSGIHDLERVVGVCRHFGVSPLVCINKYDINTDNTQKIGEYCVDQNIKVGLPVVEFSDGKVSQEIRSLWQKTSNILNGIKQFV